MTATSEIEPAAAALPGESRSVTLRTTGPLTTVQDGGRPGRSDLGVGVSGAADRSAYSLGNRLVGNPEGAAALEVTFGGLTVVANCVVSVAVTGATGPVWLRSGGVERPADAHRALVLRTGDELRLGRPDLGLRSYVAVRGGVDVGPVLGSRSTDVLAGLGPKPLAPGTVLAVGPEPEAPVPVLDVAPVSAPTGGLLTLRAVPGPRHDWFTTDSMYELFGATWEVGSNSNRVGMRLVGPALERSPARAGCELPSEGVVRGSIQVPPSGLPIVFLADHPVTGGYPVAAVLVDRDIDLAAQARPGQHIRFWPGIR